MNKRVAIATERAPAAIGTYSQAIKAGKLLFVSGQIPLHPATMALVEGGIEAQARQAFENLSEIAKAAGASLEQAVKINISMFELADFAAVNAIMAEFFSEPYPARACVQVAGLPKNALIEIEAILDLS